MNLNLEKAIYQVLKTWESPDSPEAFSQAMIRMKQIYMEESIKKSDKRIKRMNNERHFCDAVEMAER